MRARISIIGNEILCECDGAERNADIRIPLTSEALTRLNSWAQQYRRAVRSGDPSLLPDVGTQMFDWLDESSWASKWVKGAGDRELEIAVDEAESEASCALINLPWEVLADKADFLAADPVQSFAVFRSIGRGRKAKPAEAAYRDLALMFMAASPEGQQELDFEAEEAAILDATAQLPVQVVVEESGCADFLKDRLAQEGPFEVVHVSCHGDILGNGEPALAIETPEGDVALTTPGDFAGVLGQGKAPLVFLSACRTAQSGAGKAAEVTEPFVRALIRAGVPNVLGWDGSVYDADAILFAKRFYGELAEHASVPFAAAAARRDVLRTHRDDPNKGRHWHLARVYAGPDGAGPCCDPAKRKRRLRKNAGFKEFLDKANSRVRVATAQEFVGRRRHAQAVLRAFRDGGKAGVLIFGMGNLGKSSLAARIANRMPRHQTVVTYDRYDSLAVFEQLVAALPGSERAGWEQSWREQIANNGALLGAALEDMLQGPFDENPILLIIDDLEQILETPKPDQMITPVKDALGTPDTWRVSLAAVLRAFKAADTESRLLLTSRFVFTLPDGKGLDLADALERVQLHPMKDRERAKQWRAAERMAGRAEPTADNREKTLASRALAVAGGNPGLQEILFRPILSSELKAAGQALDAVERWKASGEIPTEENRAQEFFERLTFETYRNALTEPQRTQLRATTVFSEGMPVPLAALEAVGLASDMGDPRASLSRLIGLGLVDSWGKIRGVEHAAANPLARSLAGEKLTEAERTLLAAAAMPPLAEAWRDADGDFPFDQRGVEAARLALMGNAPPEVLDPAAYAAGAFLFRREHDAKRALALLRPALAKIEEQAKSPQPQILLLASDCAQRIGETGLQITLLEKGLALRSDDKVSLAQIAVRHAEATIARDGPEKALETLRDAADLFKDAGDMRSRAVTMGKIADVLQQRGETDEALRIRREEELPVYERLGDVRSRAVTMGQIADVLQQRGETDEALRTLREEVLPEFKRLGDVRSWAVTMGQIADVLLQRGETDEALRIRREEELPVYERLGDVRSRAVTMGQIADVLQQRGETDEALRIRREEQLPV